MTLRECPRAGCAKKISGDLFACSQHWHSLPSDVRDTIWQAFRAYRRGGELAPLTGAHAKAFAFWHQDGPE